MIFRSDGSTYVYNHDNRLVRYTKGTTNADYLYDTFGRRVRKTVTVGSAAPQVTWYQWDGSRLAAELDASGNIVKRYTYDEHSHNPVQMEDAGGIYDIHQDHLGTPRLVTDQQLRVVWRADYQAFGQAVVDEDPDGDGVTVTLNVRFPGQWYDAESGLHYNFYRDYDPGTGRYIESDPIGLSGGLNTYRYADANPFIFIDVFGLESWYEELSRTGPKFMDDFAQNNPMEHALFEEYANNISVDYWPCGGENQYRYYEISWRNFKPYAVDNVQKKYVSIMKNHSGVSASTGAFKLAGLIFVEPAIKMLFGVRSAYKIPKTMVDGFHDAAFVQEVIDIKSKGPQRINEDTWKDMFGHGYDKELSKCGCVN